MREIWRSSRNSQIGNKNSIDRWTVGRKMILEVKIEWYKNNFLLYSREMTYPILNDFQLRPAMPLLSKIRNTKTRIRKSRLNLEKEVKLSNWLLSLRKKNYKKTFLAVYGKIISQLNQLWSRLLKELKKLILYKIVPLSNHIVILSTNLLRLVKFKTK